MCYGMSTGAVWWLGYEMIEKNNIKIMHCNNVGFFRLISYFDYKFTN